MSQGGLLARGYVEQCNMFPVNNLITMVSPHGGVIKNTTVDMYSNFIQEHLSIGGYWRDPLQLTTYVNKCNYLPLLNNEKETNSSEQQKNNIKSLSNLVLIWSSEDTTVTPSESAKFSFYDKNYNIINIEDTELYKKDLLGLKYLNDYNKFHIYETNCTHVEHRNPLCYGQLYEIFKLYL
jgi:palmitoyl-protein thioesterase